MRNVFCFLFLLVLLAGCRQPYEPPAVKASNRFLVVDGAINTLPNSRTEFLLSRTKGLTDSLGLAAEEGGTVRIEGKSGSVYALAEQSSGLYAVDGLTLNVADEYRLNIRTRDGGQYLSDYVPVKQTPPIDSLTWKQEDDLQIYAYTHDVTNRSRYYRWDFLETWQYSSFLRGNFGLGVANGLIFFKDANTQTNDCWYSEKGREILLANSLRLSQDVIEKFRVATLPKNSEKVGIRYSTLVRQYALTEEAYMYWEVLQASSQNLGSLFDPQPGQLKGNLRNVANAAEPVIGYVSACAVQEKRLFINNRDLFNWVPVPPSPACSDQVISRDPTNFLRWNFPDTSFGPWYFVGMTGIMIAKNDCLDCRRRGGTNQKPSYW